MEKESISIITNVALTIAAILAIVGLSVTGFGVLQSLL